MRQGLFSEPACLGGLRKAAGHLEGPANCIASAKQKSAFRLLAAQAQHCQRYKRPYLPPAEVAGLRARLHL